MSKTKRLIEESIMLAIDSLSKDIQIRTDEKENSVIAQAIKVLAEAYDTVHRGYKERI